MFAVCLWCGVLCLRLMVVCLVCCGCCSYGQVAWLLLVCVLCCGLVFVVIWNLVLLNSVVVVLLFGLL